MGRCQKPGHFAKPAYSSGLVRGLVRLFLKPNQLPPSPWLRRAWARAVSLLESGVASTWPFKAGLVRSRSYYLILPWVWVVPLFLRIGDDSFVTIV